jgi:hypothetical protein
MTELLFTVLLVGVAVLAVNAILTALFGHDDDLDGPWDPGDRPRWYGRD